MKKIFKENENKICLALFLFTMLVAISPLVSRYCINGHDLEYHLLRIESLKEGILIGKPFLKVNTLFFGGAGYASSMFYSDLFMYIPAILRVLGVGIGASYHIFVAFIFILCYAGAFYCGLKMTSSKYVASLFAILLTLCPYHMDDMLVRAACGEYMAFVFVPFVIYGVYNVIFEEMDKPYIFGLGFAGLILTHPATLFFNLAFTVLAFLVFIKKILANKNVIIRLIITTAITVLITAFQWLPMLEQMVGARFYVSNDSIDMLDAAVAFSDIFTQGFPAVGILLLVLLIPRIFISKRDHEILNYVDLMIAAGFIFAIGASDIMPWERLERFLRFVQFPWRLFIMTSVLFSMSAAIILPIFVEEVLKQKVELVMVLVIALSCAFAFEHQANNNPGYYDYAKDYYSYKPYTANVIGGEWLPETVEDREMVVGLSEYMLDSEGNMIDFNRNEAVITADVSGVDYVDVPFIYYKGYKAVLTDDGQNHKLKVTSEGINGMCRVYTEGLSGQLTVYYGGTMMIHLSAMVSLLTLVGLIAFCLYRNKKVKIMKAGNVASIVITVGMIFSVMSLTACSGVNVQSNVNNINEEGQPVSEDAKAEETDFKNPDNVALYLKNKEEEQAEAEEEIVEEINYISYNVSLEGYDQKGQKFAVKKDEEPEETEYSLVSLDEAIEAGAKVAQTSNMYGKLVDEYIARLTVYYDNMNDESGEAPFSVDELKVALMQQADILLYLNYNPEGSKAEALTKLAEKMAYLIYQSSDLDGEDIVLDYNCAAVLSSSVNSLPELSCKNAANELAQRLWGDAENRNIDDESAEINRAWAAAELFKATGNKTYRTIVEAIAGDIELNGLNYEDPGYYCIFAYLSSEGSTNYSVSSRMMNHFFDDINVRIKQSREEMFEQAISKDNLTLEGESSDYINGLVSECTIAMMANYISMSIEYTRFAEDRIIFLCGANPVSMDYFADENLNLYNPVLFALCSLGE